MPARAVGRTDAGYLVTTAGAHTSVLHVDAETLAVDAEAVLAPEESTTPLAFVAEHVLLVDREDRLEAVRITL